jgi:hypothetical protein
MRWEHAACTAHSYPVGMIDDLRTPILFPQKRPCISSPIPPSQLQILVTRIRLKILDMPILLPSIIHT